MIDTGNCGASEPFALRVIGADMAPEFNPGHVVIVDPGGLVKSGCFVVAKLGEELILRQLVIVEADYRLVALQPGLPETLLTGGINDIIGVISQRSGKRRSEHKRYD